MLSLRGKDIRLEENLVLTSKGKGGSYVGREVADPLLRGPDGLPHRSETVASVEDRRPDLDAAMIEEINLESRCRRTAA